ncbi:MULTISPECIES: triose-phosphate isomerase [unclassified Neptuniibacter]|uniref:triose-phosphate isomerase n=1 Tax=unclassified Neptuniibacter TaxID=2630693 RepID=UPI0026E2E95B|nr:MULTISPECIES: triose-phosphate isomerase [unclassified Neptuniibacter]MDO6515209.1 triose-phosphate isomerase [Neptuniibacter sp. 2_MG-2023]MDO6594976.1 triose-phosphate isomerase [Neptuniibacter sp. 1_MG-2023]
MRRALVAGNWKMNGRTDFINKLMNELVSGIQTSAVDVLVCPPAIYLSQVKSLSGSFIAVGAQNVSENPDGAFTGEISLPMLSDLGCEYVILGHSERRSLYAETDLVVADKFIATVAAGLKPILCVGETLEEREQGKTLDVVGRQLKAVIDAAGIDKFADAVIAYEPVWAIGTGKTATSEQAQDVHAAIRAMIAEYDAKTASATRILYGGSVNAGNAAELFANDDVDGGLVGGASLKANDFIAICHAAGA